jgi:large repetitive protein
VKDANGTAVNELISTQTVTEKTSATVTATLHDLAPGQYQVVLEIPGLAGTRQNYGYDIKVKEAYVDQWTTNPKEDYTQHQVKGNFLDNDMLMNKLLAQTVVQFGNKVLSLDPKKSEQDIVVSGQYGTLTVKGDGSYTYTPTGKGGGKDIFVYNIVSPTGESDTATIEINVGKHVLGSSKADIIESGTANDIFSLGAGADTVIFDLLDRKGAVGGNGFDEWTDFDAAQGDKVDVKALLSESLVDAGNVKNFLSLGINADGEKVLSIDRDGLSGTKYQSTELINLGKHDGLMLDELLANNNIIF